jgi:hypothetical protein
MDINWAKGSQHHLYRLDGTLKRMEINGSAACVRDSGLSMWK